VPASSEPQVQQARGDDDATKAEQDERGERVDVLDEPSEVLAEEAGHDDEGQEHRRDERQVLQVSC
jgi:hypothetical protein